MLAEGKRKSTRRDREPAGLFSELPAALRRLRVAKKLSTRQAAKRAGVSQSEWSLWESGERTLQLDNLARVLRAIDATLHDLADELEGERVGRQKAGDVLALLAELHARNKVLEEELRERG